MISLSVELSKLLIRGTRQRSGRLWSRLIGSEMRPSGSIQISKTPPSKQYLLPPSLQCATIVLLNNAK